MSASMRQWIGKEANDTFAFDVTYNLINMRSMEQKQWGVGIFTTFDCNLRIVPVAFALILHENKENFSILFQGFF